MAKQSKPTITPVVPPAKGTKLKLTLLTMFVITSVYGLAGFPEQEFGEFCFALLGGVGIYSSARTGEKFARRPKVGDQ